MYLNVKKSIPKNSKLMPFSLQHKILVAPLPLLKSEYQSELAILLANRYQREVLANHQ